MYAPVTTVSEGYAAEIASGAHEALTGGLGAAYASRGIALHGITNGVDPDGFDPRRPKATGLRHRFDPSRGDLRGKIRCRALLLDAFNEASVSREAPASRGEPHTDLFAGVECFGSLDPADEIPLFTFVGRLTAQKGLDVLIAALRELFRARVPLRVLVLGQGDRTLEERLLRLSREVVAAGRMGVLLGFNTLLSKYVYASGDFFVIPSEYEPCGLTDYYAQLMGSLPVVHAVGGLIKVRQGQTGYTYREHSAEALCDAILEALGDWDLRRGHLESMRRKAFAEIFELHTWGRVLSDHYLPLYGNKALWNHRSD
jgi:starch synthase